MLKKDKRWISDEIELLRSCFEKGMNDKDVAKLLDRSLSAIEHKKSRIGIKTRGQRHYTNEEELEIMALRERGLTREEIAKKMNRTFGSVSQQIFKIRHKKSNNWDDIEINQLIELYNKKVKTGKIAKILGRTPFKITEKLIEIGLKKHIKSRWSEEEQNQIISMLEDGNNIEDIAKKLNRGKFAIIDQCKKLGIRKKYKQVKDFLYNCTVDELKIEKVLDRKLRAAINDSKKINREVNICISDLMNLWKEQNGLCYYSNVEMTIKQGSDDAVSIDRVNSDKGYIKGNVVLCLYRINVMKLDMNVEDFFRMCCVIVKGFRDKFTKNPREETRKMQENCALGKSCI